MRKFKAALIGGRKQSEPAPTRGASAGGYDPGLMPQNEASMESSYTPPQSTAFPNGVKVWHTCLDAAVDICFVHGLAGNRDTTWTAPGQSAPWPQTMLPRTLRGCRILTYGYDAYPMQKSVASSNRLREHAENLLKDLTDDRTVHGSSSHAIIFVAHSLGGLVCKETILQSRDHPDPHLRDVFDHTKGIVFMGTPHKGTWLADWGKIAVSAFGLVKSTNTSLLKVLQTDDQFLESLQYKYLEMVRFLETSNRPLKMTCFVEELPLPVVGVRVVSKDSGALPGWLASTIYADHRGMVRFSSEDDNGFKRVLAELIRWKGEVQPRAAPGPASTSQAPSPPTPATLPTAAASAAELATSQGPSPPAATGFPMAAAASAPEPAWFTTDPYIAELPASSSARGVSQMPVSEPTIDITKSTSPQPEVSPGAVPSDLNRTVSSSSAPISSYAGPNLTKSGTISDYDGPASSSNGPVTNNSGAVSNYNAPVSNHNGPVTNHAGPVTTYAGPVSNYSGPVTTYANPVTNYSGSVSNYSNSISGTGSVGQGNIWNFYGAVNQQLSGLQPSGTNDEDTPSAEDQALIQKLSSLSCIFCDVCKTGELKYPSAPFQCQALLTI